jgi:hypothetical protein
MTTKISYHDQIIHKAQQTSLDAYSSLSYKELGERQRQVYLALLAMGEATNKMIEKRSGIPINVVTPRIFELRQQGLVIESYRDFCPISKRKAIFWRIKNG